MIGSWQWWLAQSFAFIGLVFVIISFQQKTAKKLLWNRVVATTFVFVGLCFLGQLSAIIMCGAGIIRGGVAIFFTYKPSTKRIVKWIASGIIVVLLISLNIIFWSDYLNILSMVFGIGLVISFMQKDARLIRFTAIPVEILGITFYALLLTPVNVVIESFALLSAIVGIIRLDIKKKIDKNQLENNSETESQ